MEPRVAIGEYDSGTQNFTHHFCCPAICRDPDGHVARYGVPIEVVTSPCHAPHDLQVIVRDRPFDHPVSIVVDQTGAFREYVLEILVLVSDLGLK